MRNNFLKCFSLIQDRLNSYLLIFYWLTNIGIFTPLPRSAIFSNNNKIISGNNRHSFNKSLCKNIFQSISHSCPSTYFQLFIRISYYFPSPISPASCFWRYCRRLLKVAPLLIIWRIFTAHTLLSINTNRVFNESGRSDNSIDIPLTVNPMIGYYSWYNSTI